MHVAVYLVLAAPLLAPALLAAPAGRFLADHLAPATASRLLTASSLVLAACGVLSLVALTLAGVAGTGSLAGDRWSADAVVARYPEAPFVAVVAVGLLGAVLVRVLRAAARLRRQYRDATAAVPPGAVPGEPVRVPGAVTPARALPVLGGFVLVSAEVWDKLDTDQRAVVLAHEHAHLRRRHDLYLAAVTLAAAANPFLSPALGATAYALERWADEDAAAVVGHRDRVARTLGALALNLPPAPAEPALTATGGAVVRRVTALLGPGLSRRAAFAAPWWSRCWYCSPWPPAPWPRTPPRTCTSCSPSPRPSAGEPAVPGAGTEVDGRHRHHTRLAQRRVVLQVDLADGQVVGRPPPPRQRIGNVAPIRSLWSGSGRAAGSHGHGRLLHVRAGAGRRPAGSLRRRDGRPVGSEDPSRPGQHRRPSEPKGPRRTGERLSPPAGPARHRGLSPRWEEQRMSHTRPEAPRSWSPTPAEDAAPAELPEMPVPVAFGSRERRPGAGVERRGRRPRPGPPRGTLRRRPAASRALEPRAIGRARGRIRTRRGTGMKGVGA